MKPRVYSLVWTNVTTGEKTRRWHVEFEDSCCCDGDGCIDEAEFRSFAAALRFARHIAGGGNRWEFVA